MLVAEQFVEIERRLRTAIACHRDEHFAVTAQLPSASCWHSVSSRWRMTLLPAKRAGRIEPMPRRPDPPPREQRAGTCHRSLHGAIDDQLPTFQAQV